MGGSCVKVKSQEMTRGTLILVIGPMGSGKSMLMKDMIERYPELVTPPSYTTRARRPDAVENDHYRFVTKEEFEAKIEAGEFLEWAIFSGNYYGTLRADVEAGIEAGEVMFKEMEVQGVRRTRELLPKDELITVFIDAGGWETLKARALARAPMSEEEIEKRRLHHEDELTFMPHADVIIKNYEGEQEQAKAAFREVIEGALRKTGH